MDNAALINKSKLESAPKLSSFFKTTLAILKIDSLDTWSTMSSFFGISYIPCKQGHRSKQNN